MLKKTLGRGALVAVLSISATAAVADPINLSSWSALTLTYTGGRPAGNWVLEPGNTAVKRRSSTPPRRST